MHFRLRYAAHRPHTSDYGLGAGPPLAPAGRQHQRHRGSCETCRTPLGLAPQIQNLNFIMILR